MAENESLNEMPAAPPGYKVIKKMGQGGMAAVYLAIQESFGRQVALKIMSDQLGQDPVWAKRFIREAQVVAQLSHPNIVPVFDVGTFNGRYYISMELLKGGGLEDKMAKGLSVQEAIKIIVGVAAGLDYAGEKGFVHRDIKPDNVMFREDGSPVILDFGIVKQKGGGNDKMTQTGTIVGTTSYMSPEQAMGKELDEGSDIYSLGVMFYELLTGRVPFHGDSAVAVLLKHVNEPPPPLPDSISVLQPVIDKAMAKKREDRYPRARMMIEHIQELEPQIRQMIAEQKAAFANMASGGANDATNVQAAVGGKPVTSSSKAATMLTGAIKPNEDDLSTFLTSAKATINNFSEESRVRRAKNLKRAIIAGVVVVVGALSYVAYQQFYVVPRAGALAAEQRKEKIDTLMSAAEDTLGNLDIKDLKKVDGLIAEYGEVLVLDPENTDVHAAMDKLGAQYVELANEALKANNYTDAENYSDYAARLSPKNTELASLRDALKKSREASGQQELESKFNTEQVTKLMTEAQSYIRAGKTFTPSDDCAYSKLQQVFKFDPTNAEAQNQINTLLNNLYTETQSFIASQQFRNAASNLDLLDKYFTDKTKLSALKSSYASTKQKADEQSKLAGVAQKKDDLLAKAARLKRDQRTSSSNDDMREAYLGVLDIESGNTTALAGLQDASRFDAEQAEQAIKKRDYSHASQYLGAVEKYTPAYADLAALKSRLSQAKSSAQKADQLLASAHDLIGTSKVDDGKRQDLAKAYGLIDSAKQADPANPGIATTLSALETQYLITLSPLMATQQRDLVAAYFNDTKNMTWPTDNIYKAQMAWQSAPTTFVAPAAAADKPKPKRVMSGGF